MRQLLYGCIAFLCTLTACRRDNAVGTHLNGTPSTFASQSLASVEQYLKDSMPRPAYDSLDFTGILVSTSDSGVTWFIRVPSRGLPIAHHFVLLRTADQYGTFQGAVFQLTRNAVLPTAGSSGNPEAAVFNGTVSKSWLNGTLAYSGTVTGGYIGGLQGGLSAIQPSIEMADEPTYVELPEIVIVAPDDPDDYYIDLSTILSETSGGGSATGFIGSSGGSTPISYTAANSALTFNPALDPQAINAGIKIQEYLACFGNIPDAGATYSASLMVRIPNIKNPGQLLNPLTMQVGHAFIALTKSNTGYKSVTQYIGFYANSPMTFTNLPVASKLVDNSNHLYDAQLTVKLSSSQFGTLTDAMVNLAGNDYSLTGYNCSAYATDAFNSILTVPLEPSLMAPPNMQPGIFPNSLYEDFQSRPASAGGTVTFFPTDQVAGKGNGACN